MNKSDLQQQLKQAMIAKDELKLSTLRMLLSAVQASETQGEKHDATEEEIAGLVGREIKRRKEAIEEFTKGGREDLAKKEHQELEILEAYLPPQLSPEEVEGIVKQAIQSTGAASAANFGKAMKEVSAKTKGRADGKMVSELVKKLLV